MQRLTFAFLLVWTSIQFGCAGLNANSSKSAGTNSPPSTITVSVSPNPANVRMGSSQQFSATVSGSANTSVNWFVNDVSAGSAAIGTMNSAGVYAPPASLLSPNTVTVKAITAADPNVSASSTVTLLNPIPVLANIAPQTTALGAFALTINGANFVQGAQVLFAGLPLNTTFLSSTQLTATGMASSAGMFSISVLNPNPGSASSNSVNLQAGPAVPQTSTCSGMSLGQGASLNGFVPFPADNAWNKNISADPLDPNSAAIINFIGAGISVHPDFGAGLYQGQSMGIPYLVVGSQQGPVDINFTAFGGESDPGPMPMYISGVPDDRWDNNDLHKLSNVTASDFEVVLMNPIYTASNLPQGAAPTISSFTANPSTTTAGTPVTLNWTAAGASYFVISPDVGAVRGTSVTVTPAQTTTYALAGTNQYGRTTATVTVIVK